MSKSDSRQQEGGKDRVDSLRLMLMGWRSDVHRQAHRRRGLAPLEFVLALPLLLFISALMVNFSMVANWKLRALCVARQQLWGSRRVPNVTLGGSYVQPDYTQPVPAFWQAAQGTASHGGAGGDSNLDQNQIGAGTTVAQVVRGPQVGSFQFADTANINAADLLNPGTGLLQGSSGVTPIFPYFKSWPVPPLNPQIQLLNDPWPSWAPQMTWTDDSRQNNPNMALMGLANNIDVRVPLLYTEPTPSPPLDIQTAYLTPRGNLYNFYLSNQSAVQFLNTLVPDFNDANLPPAWGWQYPYQTSSFGCDMSPGDVGGYVATYIKYLPQNIINQIKNDIAFYNYQIQTDQAALGATPQPSADEQAQLNAQISADQGIVQALQSLLQALGSLS